MSAPGATAVATTQFDPGATWRLHPQVALRPEPFGALLYHFGTRKLSFLKNTVIVDVVRSLDDHASVREALRAHGIDESAERPYVRALGTLADSHMIVPA
ncbi:mycofactocin biosynthesis chaperone MftB [Rhodococcus sp. (in: high G+C Gram-positive bacteria)]|jgi:putative mycofactocin binding protein MftB|uniref:mycofactocin biosynthesis chaperone MftB n=1 Tax=unclassified Rhodococcus (in: high G+C Gram-positive bacteria) TaxID=192944 RepID=UPI001A060B18|nr:mycofactocin biosynthesis chaperone MftB [Rhodococcus sp. (in: high G+C Gram-positive bacteria)]MBF0661815.1 mycofactocin biosynthesis chaperone MftB [Rhodococcus sp. (in: high G+C Gram-positive bacteria)]